MKKLVTLFSNIAGCFKITKISILIFTMTVIFISSGSYYTCRAATTFPGSIQYVVKSGDSLYLISKYNNVSTDTLKVVNGLKSDLINVGQVLNIPYNTSKIFDRYTIRSGDTLYSIGNKYGVPFNRIMLANSVKESLIIPGQVLTIPYMQFSSLSTIVKNKGIDTSKSPIDIVVDKSEHTLLLFSNGEWLKTYHVELGSNGLGDKQVSGDHKTPEGTFYISQKSSFNPPDVDVGSRWMRISYPNKEDAIRGLNSGVISSSEYNDIVNAINNGSLPPQQTALGGGVGVHGGTNLGLGVDWTWGCIGLTNTDAEDIYDYVNVGTRVIIQK